MYMYTHICIHMYVYMYIYIYIYMWTLMCSGISVLSNDSLCEEPLHSNLHNDSLCGGPITKCLSVWGGHYIKGFSRG